MRSVTRSALRVQDPTASPRGESQLPVPQIPQATQQQPRPQQPQVQITLATVNARGLCDRDARISTWNALKRLKADIICVQETKIQQGADEQFLSEGWGGEVFWAFSDRSAAGVAILFSERSSAEPIGPATTTPGGRFVSVPFTWEGQRCTITCIYGPSTGSITEREEFYSEIHEALEDPGYSGSWNFVAGDFNCFTDGTLDKHGGNQNNTAPPALNTMMATLNLLDAFRWKHPSKKDFTWERGDIASRLDKILVPATLTPMILTARHHRVPRTDHKAVVVTLSPKPPPSVGRGYWMMKTSLLENKTFTESVKTYLREHPRERFQDWTSWFRSFSAFAQDKGKEIGKTTAEHNRVKIERMCSQLDELMDKKRSTPPDQALNAQIREKKAILYSTFKSQAQEWKRLSEGRHILLGDKCSRFFSSLAKARTSQATIPGLRDHGRYQEGTDGALRVASEYYSALFSQAPTTPSTREARDILLDKVWRRLSFSEAQSLEQAITAAEVLLAIKAAPKNKSPGCDGLPAEFWASVPDLAPLLAGLFNEWLEKGEIPDEVNTGILTLLPKKGDLSEIKNYRPIALLPTILKVLTRVLNTRLRRVIGSVVAPSQAAAPGRFIHTNTRLVADVLEYLTNTGNPGGVILLDQEKAFDRVDWTFLEEVMVKMNFGQGFLKSIRTLGRNATSRIKINNTISDPVHLERGVRQGDTLSPSLFILYIQPLINLIDLDPEIRGVPLPGGITAKVAAYADDTAPFFSDGEDVVRIRRHMETFEKATGAKFNANKSEGIVIGMPPPDQIFKWTTDPKQLVRYLGVMVAGIPSLQDQWASALKTFEECLAKWKKITTTLHGKVAILKHFALPCLTYTLQALPCPEEIQDQVQELSWAFLWRGKKAKINRHTCELPKAAGGLGLPNFKDVCKRIQSKWIRRVTEERTALPKAPWTALPEHHLRKPNAEWGHGDMAVHCPSTHSQAKKVTSPFWRGVLEAHWKRSPELLVDNNNVRKQPLFNNSRLTKPGGAKLSSSRWTKWVEAGVTTVGDLLQGNTFMSVEELSTKHRTLKPVEINAILSLIPDDFKQALLLNGGEVESYRYRDREEDQTSPKGEQEWTTSLFPPPSLYPSWTKTYVALWRSQVPHRWKETFYLTLRRSHYLGATAQRHGWNDHPHNCALCDVLETFEHTFLDCPQAAEVWAWVDQTWTRLTRKRPPPHLSLNSSPLWQCLSLGAVHAIWLGRCSRAHGAATHSLPILKGNLKRVHAALGPASPLSHVL